LGHWRAKKARGVRGREDIKLEGREFLSDRFMCRKEGAFCIVDGGEVSQGRVRGLYVKRSFAERLKTQGGSSWRLSLERVFT